MRGEEPIELGLQGHEQEFLEAVRRDPIYQGLFPQAFPGDNQITLQLLPVNAFVQNVEHLGAPALRKV